MLRLPVLYTHRRPRESQRQSFDGTFSIEPVSYFKLFRFATYRDKILINISLLSSLLGGATVPYNITLVANFFDIMSDYEFIEKPSREQTDLFMQRSNRLGLTYMCMGVVTFCGAYLGTSLMSVACLNQISKMRQAYFRTALYQDYKRYDSEPSDFASVLAQDVIKIEEGIGEKLSAMVFSCSATVCCITMALIQGWKLTFTCLLSFPLAVLLIVGSGIITFRFAKREVLGGKEANLLAEEVLSSIRTVYAYSGQSKELQLYKTKLESSRKCEIKKGFFSGLLVGIIYICLYCSYSLSFYVAMHLIQSEPQSYNLSKVFSIFFGVISGTSNFIVIENCIGIFAEARVAGATLFDMLDKPSTCLSGPGLVPKDVKGNLEFKDVIFYYPARPHIRVLNGFSMSAKRGQSVAFVGHSGCGKSTIIQLIVRYFDILDGQLLFDDYDIEDLSVHWLREQIGIVHQEPVLFNTTIRDNIRFGWQNASDTDIEEAATQAQAHNFIMQLPMGYDTILEESGASLSIGQKQRIAIARAIIRDPPILLLDEATSALDNLSEFAINMALAQASKGRTTVIVAHRLSTVRNVDVIYVMEKGKVVEKGNHIELKNLKGHYAELLAHQHEELRDSVINIGGIPQRRPTRNRSVQSVDLDKYGTRLQMEEVRGYTYKEDAAVKLPPQIFWQAVKLNSTEWKSIVIGSISSIVIGFHMPVFITQFGDLYDNFSRNIEVKSENMEKLAKQVVIFSTYLGIVIGTCIIIEAMAFSNAGAHLTMKLRYKMFEHLLNMNICFFDVAENSTPVLCSILATESTYVQMAIGDRIGTLLQSVGSLLYAILLSIFKFYDYRIAMLCTLCTLLLAVAIYYQSKIALKRSFQHAKSLENSNKIAAESVKKIREVMSLGLEEKFLNLYIAAFRTGFSSAKKSAHLHGIVSGMVRSLFVFMDAMALTLGSTLIVSGHAKYEKIIITTQTFQMVASQLQNVFIYATNFERGIVAASRVIAILNAKPVVTETRYPVEINFRKFDEVTMQNVEFRYPSRPGDKILRGFELKVDKGRHVALVGRSGSGKSTVIKLLERFYDADIGNISLNNIPIKHLRIDDVRYSLGYISQEPVLFNRTLMDNIAYGDNSREVTLEEVVEAAKLADIHEFIETLPLGYKTNVGVHGAQLSGGQKQRIAIARALIRKPMILLLDEATSALDAECEEVIFLLFQAVTAALERAAVGRTTITIAHRLTTVRNADLICVLKSGRIIEKGTHDALMAKRAMYYRLSITGA